MWENIKKARKARGMTQADLAAAVNYENSTAISKIESGKINFPAAKLLEIAEALNTAAYRLLPDHHQPRGATKDPEPLEPKLLPVQDLSAHSAPKGALLLKFDTPEGGREFAIDLKGAALLRAYLDAHIQQHFHSPPPPISSAQK